MAKKVVSQLVCDACELKGEEEPSIMQMKIDGDVYDLCKVHGDRFKRELRLTFNRSVENGNAA
ncbi:hypothetical protein [Streptomyces sp. NPDC051561]|uniref:hypothetical protein n=1 Tax=Streptomyces sp. NPDC051561 TaxID=3365658 RepID=UPI0037B2AAD2